MKHNLTLVTLSAEQIVKAKAANGPRQRITHALICGPYGQMFGTEKQCLKYWLAWDPNRGVEVSLGNFRAIFPDLFDRAVRAKRYEISDFEHTFNLVNKLNALQDGGRLENETDA